MGKRYFIDEFRGSANKCAPTNFFSLRGAACALAVVCLFLISINRASTTGAASAPSVTNHFDDRPSIDRVDPPDWWVNHSINPVRLLIYGSNLQGATASLNYPGVRLSDLSSGERGTYLFASLHVNRTARPGSFNIRIQTSGGQASAAFTLKRPLARAGRFQGFSPSDVIYLIMPDRFSDKDRANNDPPESRGLYSRTNPRAYHGGDIQGIIDRLPYLKNLGVTAIWTTPVYDNTSRLKDYDWGKGVTDYHGYGAINFYRVEEHLGTLEKYKELVDRAHVMGIKIIQDQVANHSGPDHRWASDAPTPTWLNGSLQNHLNNVFDIKAITDERPDSERFEATIRGWFANTLPDINQDDSEAARYVIQNAVWWVDSTGLDGIRQDTFPYVPRRFWSEWNLALKRAFPRLTVVGEVFDQRPEVTSFFQGGRARFDGVDTHLHTVFDFPSYYAMREVFIKDQPMKRLADVLEADRLYTNPQTLVTFISNHDVTRFMSEPGASVERLMMAFTYLLTMRGTPQIYYGDEIGIEGREDPDNRRDFPGGFPGDSRSAFTERGRSEKERKVFNHVRALLRLRARRAALTGGDMRVLVASDTALAYLRESSRDRVIVAFNNSDRLAEVEIPVPGSRATSRPQARTWVEVAPVRGGWRGREASGKIKVRLQPRDSMILVESR